MGTEQLPPFIKINKLKVLVINLLYFFTLGAPAAAPAAAPAPAPAPAPTEGAAPAPEAPPAAPAESKKKFQHSNLKRIILNFLCMYIKF